MTLLIRNRRTKGNSLVVNSDTGESTFDPQGRWTPQKDGSGFVLSEEWAGLPLNTWIQWGGVNTAAGSTALETQLSTPFGAAAGYAPSGSNPTRAHYDNFTGCAFDEVNGIFYHFGGGHTGGSNNMFTSFDARKGIHTVIVPPTHSSMYPTGYAGSGQYQGVNYPSGQGFYNYFPSVGVTPLGDDGHCATHTYGGMVYIPDINEVVSARHGWFHVMLDSGAWDVGPQVPPAERVFWDYGRGGIGWRCFYVPSTQRVYMTASPSSPHGGLAQGSVIVYNPATRDETTAFGYTGGAFNATYSNACVAPLTVGTEKKVMWYFQGPFNDNTVYQVFAVNLTTGTMVANLTNVLGRKPASTSGASDSDNPCIYVDDLDTIMIWCTATSGSAGGAVNGEMLNFNRTTKTCSLHAMSGTPPPLANRINMNNKMRYWPSKKVLLFQTATHINCYVIKLA